MSGWRRSPAIVLSLIVSIIGFAVAATGSGMDRLAAADHAIEKHIPAPFRANANHAAAAVALFAKDYSRAVVLARDALEATPAEARGPNQLALALLQNGDLAAADRAFSVARQMGRREPAALASTILMSLERADYPAAAEDLEALLRTQPELALTGELLSRLSLNPGGRRALAHRLEQDGLWTGQMLRSLTEEHLSAVQPLLQDAEAYRSPLGCDVVREPVTRLMAAGRRPVARQIWTDHCDDTQSRQLLADGKFARFASSQADPFGWQRLPSGDVRISIANRASGAIIEATNTAPLSRPLIAQDIELDAGNYLISTQAGTGSERLFWRIECPGTSQILSTSDRQIAVPEDCREQRLTLWLEPDKDAVRISSVEITRAD